MDNENKVPEQSDEVISQPKAGFATKASNFAQSMISKGLKGNKADPAVTDLRNMSCNGDPARKLPPCSERQDSVNFPGSFFCGACGCGDKEMTLLKARQLKNELLKLLSVKEDYKYNYKSINFYLVLFVAEEVYNNYEYLQKIVGVYSTKDLNISTLETLSSNFTKSN